MKNKIVLITGATSGIGWATALTLAKAGAQLILCGRRTEKLKALAKEIGGTTQLLTFDVRDKDAVFKAIASLPDPWKSIDLLVNNAGNAHGLDPVQTASLEDWDAMIDGNVKGLMYVTKAVLPHMIAAKKGQIINLGSIAGKEVYPNGSAYCSSKAAVDFFTRGLRIDLNPLGIRVGAIHPGLVETEFSEIRFKGDQARAKTVYDGIEALTAEEVADAILYMAQVPEKVTIADLVILPTRQANAYVNNRIN
ncbi:SDR family NAD(P)-dependent oxidoreductase [Flavobacteriaceae bacterium]|mgnify:FL=1|jgi:3-hydroxy acid dehydrogenase/malonic semialdehyde reductase|nr:SDR family NAD(P)-dependent oxidoreductase [Flavobacteriaceae bacterium]MDA7808024.1 SDR family NAD(P)-dependent oxidoreductase [Flavobacteriaceae bacterium]MDA9038085.1 SDR family NAD(P)-dependent oxidoreductase [Flavobacteriaceae bacterium]MDA9587931.1 SDR family NAD(P)-dependent oxidoreductase [Flavobacteriaceae bacterium]